MPVYYTKDHEWVRLDGDNATVGITDHAQQQLGDVVYVELPEVGRTVKQGETAAWSKREGGERLYAPGRRRGRRAQQGALKDPRSSTRPESEGWFFKLPLADAGELDGADGPGRLRRLLETLLRRRGGTETRMAEARQRLTDRAGRFAAATSARRGRDRGDAGRLGAASLDALIDATVPAAIRRAGRWSCRRRLTETAASPAARARGRATSSRVAAHRHGLLRHASRRP